MKINPATDKSLSSVNTPVTTRVAGDGKPAAAVSKVDATGAPVSATVTLSSTAASLLSATDPTFDAEKVAQIKASIDGGTYQVNADVIADKLLSNARELLSRSPS